MKSIALQTPATAAKPTASSLQQLVARVRVGLARIADAPTEVSETERLVREAQQLRAAFLRGSARDE